MVCTETLHLVELPMFEICCLFVFLRSKSLKIFDLHLEAKRIRLCMFVTILLVPLDHSKQVVWIWYFNAKVGFLSSDDVPVVS